jgi:hypothetical protein
VVQAMVQFVVDSPVTRSIGREKRSLSAIQLACEAQRLLTRARGPSSRCRALVSPLTMEWVDAPPHPLEEGNVCL